MKKFRPFLLLLILLLSTATLAFATFAFQDTPPLRLEITGVNVAEMPTVTVTANVYDTLGQPVLGLTEANFALLGDLSGVGRITRVENITDNNLPIATVLVIDVSSSMLGSPINNAKLAAQAFVDNIGPNDPVAIMTFGSAITVLQDYTTDKAALSAVITSIEAGGETALYQGAFDAITVASQSPTQRHAVILLSDGAEYGDASNQPREAAAAEALALGVPVYSIGLGFGIDRTYLQQLSAATSSQYFESPNPDQLTEIYTTLAAQLRSQYVITLDVPVPLDGTQYTLQLEATSDAGSANASAVLRAPIPVPIPTLPIFNDPLTVPTEITASVLADDTVESVSFQLGDAAAVVTSADAPTITINPVDYLPGDYPLIVTAIDENGDSGSAGIQLTIGALPSEIALNPALASLGAVNTPQTIAVETSGQTPAATASITFNDADSVPLSEPFGFTIDPLDFAPGNNTVTVSVTNEGGVTSERSFDFIVAALPPQLTVVGLEDGQSIDEPTEFTVEAVAQESVSSINVSVNEQVLEPDANGIYTLDPMNFSPGVNTVIVRATAANGQISQQEIDVAIAALPPIVQVVGLEAGETISEDRAITFEFTTQSPVVHVAVFIDGADLAHLVTPPFGFTLHVLDFEPGDHVMRIIADNTDGQQGTLELPFSIAPEAAASATSNAVTATQAAQATATQQAEASATAVEATQVALATGTQAAVDAATQVVQMTQLANSAATKAADDATATQIKLEATGTQMAVATQSAQQAQLNTQATATDIAQNTQAAVDQATLDARATATAEVVQATQTALAAATTTQETANAQATQAAQSTRDAQASATQLLNNLATLNARMTATSVAQGTVTQVAQATQNYQATSTAIVNGTATQATQAMATAFAQATSTAAAQATATSAAEATEQSTLDAQATQNARTIATRQANASATALMNATVTVQQATEQAQASATQQANATATERAAATATAASESNAATQAALATLDALEATATANANATATAASADDTATQSAAATLSALEATATEIIVNATATRNALETQTANNATATQSVVNATATITTNQELIAQSTADSLATRNAVATSERAAQITVTAQRLADLATATADANATATAALVITEEATQDVDETAVAQATLDTRQTAVGPTATVTPNDAQSADLLTPSPQATLTEVQANEVANSSNITPIVIVLIVIVFIIFILVLIMRGRGSSDRR